MKNVKSLIILSLLALTFTQCKKDEPATPATGCAANTCAHTLGSGQTAGTVAASTVGMHNLTMQYATAASPYTDGTTGEFEITSDNKLVVKLDGKCVTLSNPYQTGTSEVTYVDNCEFNLIFGVSEKNGGGLNEINIGSLGTPTTFLGQFHD